MKINAKFLLRVAGGLAAATFLSLVASGIAFWSAARTLEANRLVLETLEVTKNLDDVLAGVNNAENGQRGYVLTGDEAYLESYISATLEIDQKIRLLRHLTAGELEQQRQLDFLESLVTKRLAQIKEIVNLRRDRGLDAALVLIRRNQGRVMTDRIGQILREIEAQEKGLLLQRQQTAAISTRHSIFAFFGSVILNILIFGAVYKLVYKEILKRTQVEQEIKELNEDLEHRVLERTEQLEQALRHLQQTQSQLIQAEKMSSLGQLVAGVAHEINNPVNFIYGNLIHAKSYVQDLLKLLYLYQKYYPNPAPEIEAEKEAIEIDFLSEDLPKLLTSMNVGAERIQKIVLSLRNFSRMDEAEVKAVDIHEGIESTLMILQHRLKAKPDRPAIELIKEYGNLPLVECYAGLLNQVFMNILTNALDALEERDSKRSPQELQQNPSKIRIRTGIFNSDKVRICIADNGLGMTKEVQQRLFNPFFTTKPVGKGTGMGMSIGYQIVTEKHQGELWCVSAPGQGAEFWIEIPIRRSLRA